MKLLLYISMSLFLFSCVEKSELSRVQNEWQKMGTEDAEKVESDEEKDAPNSEAKPTTELKTGNLRNDLIEFSKQFIGTPYKFACATPEEGFDCSGFITYVYNHYGIEVPRSSKDFEFFGKEISVEHAREGDLLLFTGTEEGSTGIGHIGILINQNGMKSDFIHASSGKANGVTISSLGSDHYTQRFVKAISIIE